jgi:hypothetical protein
MTNEAVPVVAGDVARGTASSVGVVAGLVISDPKRAELGFDPTCITLTVSISWSDTAISISSGLFLTRDAAGSIICGVNFSRRSRSWHIALSCLEVFM